MNKLSLEYVASGYSRLGMFVQKILEDNQHEYKPHILKITQKVNDILDDQCKFIDPRFSILYNAYTEAEYPNYFKKFDNFNANAIYADSGGLQIVTQGLPIDDRIKNKIYGVQQYATYATCFDSIPLENTAKKLRNNERMILSNKIFNQDKHAESGAITGKNIKDQIARFRADGAKTKVIVIVQGNQMKDMLLYFNEIQKQLSDDDYDYIGGLAVADTCMGNGMLESIEMLKAARAISKISHPNVSRHLHILGLGTLSRLRPILYLIRSGYLDKYQHISYDSSTTTSSYDFGKVVLNEKLYALGQFRTETAIWYFKKVYDFFEDTFKPLGSFDDMLNIVFGDPDDIEQEDKLQCWKFSTVKNRTEKFTEIEKIIFGLLIKPSYVYYQFVDFILSTDRAMIENEGNNFALMKLLQVKDEKDMNEWFSHHSRSIDSRRIRRKEDISSLEGFFI